MQYLSSFLVQSTGKVIKTTPIHYQDTYELVFEAYIMTRQVTVS